VTNQFTEYTRTGYLGRIGNSFVGAIFGFVLFVGSFALLFWNEGSAVKTAQMLAEGAAKTISVPSDSVDPANEGKLVHFSGGAVGQSLTDPMFGVSADAIQLQRQVEMYQWKEKVTTDTQKDTVGGGQTSRKTYSYSKVWSQSVISSGEFKDQSKTNPSAMRIESQSWTADPVKVGGYTLPADLVTRIDNFTILPLADNQPEGLPSDIRQDAKLSGGLCYVGGRTGQMAMPEDPVIGDLKITLRVVKPGPVSVIAKQADKTVTAYTASNGKTLELLSIGDVPANLMFAQAERENEIRTWIFRVVGFLAMWFGLVLILSPLSTLFDVIGLLGSLVGAGIGLAAFLVAAVGSSITIAIAWVFYRPLIGIAVLGVSAAIVAYMISRARQAAARRILAPSPSGRGLG
jgi:hypothetical protein